MTTICESGFPTQGSDLGMMSTRTLLVATRNPGKMREYRELLARRFLRQIDLIGRRRRA